MKTDDNTNRQTTLAVDTIYDMFGYTLPGTNYCGQGNRMGRKTRSALDRACRKHDIAYEEYTRTGEWPVWYNNSADARLLEAAQNDPTLAGYVTRAFFRGKRILAPRMNEPPRKRQHREPEDLPSNVLPWRQTGKDLTTNLILPSNKLEVGHRMSHNRSNYEYVPGLKIYGPHVGVPKTYQPGPSFNFRDVVQFTTTPTIQVDHFVPFTIGRAAWNNWISQIPIRYWDEVAAVPSLKEGQVGTLYSQGNQFTRRGNMKFHFSIQIFMRLKNNSLTEAELQIKEVEFTAPTDLSWLDQVTNSFYGAVESTTVQTPPWHNNPLYNAFNWHNDTKEWKYGGYKRVFLQPGQSTTVYLDYSLIVDPNDVAFQKSNIGTVPTYYIQVPKQREIHIRLNGDLGHEGTNVALCPVNAIDCDYETKVKIHISSNTYKDKLLTTGSDGLYTAAAVKNINQQGDMILE